jgi:hypothetical protein
MKLTIKKLGACLAAALVLALASASPAKAASPYVVTLTTYVPTASATDFTLGAYPNVSGNVHIRKIVLANAGDALQTFSIYNNATSSTAATLKGRVVVPSSSTVSLDFVLGGFTFTNPAFTKSSTSSTLTATIQGQ